MIELLTFEEEAHEYRINHVKKSILVPSISQIIAYCGVSKPSSWQIPQFYADRGTEIHDMTELMDAGTFLEEFCTAEALPFLLQYENFLLEHDIEVMDSESLVFDTDLFIAGRLDRYWSIDGTKHLTDIKSGQKLREHAVQATFYTKAHGKMVQSISNLYLKDGSYELYVWKKEELDVAERIIKAMSDIYWFAHPRDYRDLVAIRDLCKKSIAKDEFFFN